MGLVLPNNGFLKALSEDMSDNEALLIFDEVMTGFRLAKGGAQEIYNVTPDITTLESNWRGSARWCLRWKIEIMNSLAPIGPVYQAGALSGNPLAMHRIICIKKVRQQTISKLDTISNECRNSKNIDEIEINAVISRIGSMMTFSLQIKKK